MEVAGLVLAVLPLLISALGEYKVSVSKLSRSIQYHSAVKKLTRSAKGQKVFFIDNLHKLLNAAIPKAGEIRNLSDDYSSELWSGSTEEKIQEYLGQEKYELFQEMVGEFESCLCNLEGELDRVRRSPKVWSPVL
jgi:hypothetical protein